MKHNINKVNIIVKSLTRRPLVRQHDIVWVAFILHKCGDVCTYTAMPCNVNVKSSMKHNSPNTRQHYIEMTYSDNSAKPNTPLLAELHCFQFVSFTSQVFSIYKKVHMCVCKQQLIFPLHIIECKVTVLEYIIWKWVGCY